MELRARFKTRLCVRLSVPALEKYSISALYSIPIWLECIPICLHKVQTLPTILDEIVANKQIEIQSAKKRVPQSDLESQCKNVAGRPDFFKALTSSNEVSLIAEVKKASPSKGLIRKEFNPVEIAAAYESSGASCISVLTDEKYFQGHLDFLHDISKQARIPLLRKEFVVDPYQVYEAKVAGASGVLLIAECLEETMLKELHDLIEELGMTPLVEFHEKENLEVCLRIGARLIGVNNRNLKTFETDLGHVISLRQQIPEDRAVVAESGIFTHDDVLRIRDANIQAMLVGESLMRQQEIGQAVRDLLGN